MNFFHTIFPSIAIIEHGEKLPEAHGVLALVAVPVDAYGNPIDFGPQHAEERKVQALVV